MVAGYMRSSLNAASTRRLPICLGGYYASPRPASASYKSIILLNCRVAGFTSSTVHCGRSTRKQNDSKDSSAQKPSKPSEPPSSSWPLLEYRRGDDVNAPASTLPAPLELPEKPPSPGLSYYFSLGRAYYGFYKTGVKNIWHNYKEARPVFQQFEYLDWFLSLKVEFYPSRDDLGPRVSPGLFSKLRTHGMVSVPRLLSSLRTVGEASGRKRLADFEKFVTRTDRRGLQLMKRSGYDSRRMIPFSLVLLVFGELTPFVVGMGLITPPGTCVQPRHADEERGKRAKMKGKLLAETQSSHVRDLFPVFGSGSADIERLVKDTSTEDMHHSGLILGAIAEPWFPALGRWGIFRFHRDISGRRDLYSHLVYLAIDDALIIRGGGVQNMSAAEVRMAVDERGGVEIGAGLDLKAAEKDQRWWLEQWIKSSEIMLMKHYWDKARDESTGEPEEPKEKEKEQ